MTEVVLTVADHEKNGFIALAKWTELNEVQARAAVAAIDATIGDDAEPDIKTAPFTFILDLIDEGNNFDLIDTGKRLLPTQTAMALAPDQVRQWLDERPDPEEVFGRSIPEAPRASLISSLVTRAAALHPTQQPPHAGDGQ